MRIFIDTNIYLNFIRSNGESLKSLTSLEELITKGKLSLVFPKITLDELIRNIPNVEAVHKKEIDQHLPKKPVFAASVSTDQQTKIEHIHAQYKTEINSLKRDYEKSVTAIKTRIIDKLWGQSNQLEDTAEIVNKAHTRKIKGNPPGKTEHIGDELEWELLLEYCYDDDLSVVTFDRDWFDVSSQKKNALHPLLSREWTQKSKKQIKIYSTLGDFINSTSPKKLITKKEIMEEKQNIFSLNPIIQTSYITPYASVSSSASAYQSNHALGSITSLVSASPSASFTPNTLPQYVQCFSCARIIPANEYYGFTPHGYACKYCAKF